MSIAFAGMVAPDTMGQAGDDASAAAWMDTHNLPRLAFDHKQIILEALGQSFLDGALCHDISDSGEV